MRITNLLAMLLAAALTLLPGAAGAAHQGATLNLKPADIRVNAFFDGTTLRVNGLVPDGDQVAVRLTSDPKDTSFRVKDRRWGVLWMNQGEVAFHGAPTVYMLQTSKSPGEFHLGLGYLRAHTTIHSGRGDSDKLFGEFIKIKKGEGLYNLSSGVVSLGPAKDGMRSFECSFSLPPRIPLGAYHVQSFLKEPDGKVKKLASREIKVEEVGFPAILSNLAYHYGLLYGILASLVAIVGGLITSLLFKGGGGAH